MGRRNDPIKALFADQFSETDEGEILFRRSGNGPAIVITAEERDALIARYGKALILMTWLGVLLSLILIGGVISLFAMAHREPADFVVLVTIFVACAPVLFGQLWAWEGPSRFLAGRLPVKEAISKSERKIKSMSAINWPGLAMAAGTGLAMLVMTNWRKPLSEVDNLLCLGGAAVLLGLSAIQALRKVTFEFKRKSRL